MRNLFPYATSMTICPYCHHPFKEADAEHVCQQSAEYTGTCFRNRSKK